MTTNPRPGSAYPLGATVQPGGVNFSVYADKAKVVELLLFDGADDSKPAQAIRLDARQHRTYHWGDIEALLAVLDPDVVVRGDRAAVPPGASREIRGASAVVEQALNFTERAQFAQPALVNGAVGVVVAPRDRKSVV